MPELFCQQWLAGEFFLVGDEKITGAFRDFPQGIQVLRARALKLKICQIAQVRPMPGIARSIKPETGFVVFGQRDQTAFRGGLQGAVELCHIGWDVPVICLVEEADTAGCTVGDERKPEQDENGSRNAGGVVPACK